MNTIVEHINSTGHAFVEFALPMLIQSSVLIVILLLLDLLLRKKVKAVFRYWIWMLVLLKLVLPTSLSSPLSLGYLFGEKLTYEDLAQTSPTLEPAVPAQADISSGVGSIYIQPNPYVPPKEPVVSVVEPVIAEPVDPPDVPVTPLSWQGVVFLVWLAVVIAMGLLLLQRALFVRGLVAQAKKAGQLMNDALSYCCASMGIKTKVGLKVSVNAMTPSVCGLIRPVILVPWKLTSTLGASRLKTILMHELAHIKRGDLWVNLAQTALQIIYFYNPLLWLANFVIRRIREQAVDEAVLVAMGEKAQKYPQTLVDVAKMAFKRPALGLRLIGVVESKSALAGRIKHILGRPMPKSARLGLISILAIIVAGAVLLPMAKARNEDRFSDKDLLIKFVELPEGEAKKVSVGDTTVWSKGYEVEFAPGEDLLVVVEMYQAGQPMRIIGRNIFEGSQKPEKFTVTFVRAYQDATKTYVTHNIKFQLGDQAFTIPVHTPRYLSTQWWDWYRGEGLPRPEMRHTKTRYAGIETLFYYGAANLSMESEYKAKFWIPGRDVTPVMNQYGIALKMIPLSSLQYLYVEPIGGYQGLDGKIISMSLTLEEAARIADEYKKMVIDSVEKQWTAEKQTDPEVSVVGASLDHFVGKYAMAKHPDTAAFEITKKGDVFIFRDLGGPKFEMELLLKGLEGRSFEMEKGRDSLRFGKNPRERYSVRYNTAEDRYILDRLGMRGEVQDSLISPLTELVRIPAAKPEDTFAATLPNGVIVELVGVCEHPSEGKQWWRPDGSLLAQAPYDQLDVTSIPEAKPNERIYEFAYRLSNGMDTISISATGEVIEHGGMAIGAKNNAMPTEISSSINYFPKDQKATTLSISSAVFKNVSLRPGVQTDVQVEVQAGTKGTGENKWDVGGVVIKAVNNKATLKSSVTVELAGLTYIPADDQPWWKPDGSPMESLFDRTDYGPGKDPDKDQYNYYAAAVSIDGLPPEEVFSPKMKWHAEGAEHTDNISIFKGDENLRGGNLYAAAIKRISKDAKSTDLQLGLAVGEWETIAKGRHMGFYEIGDDTVILREPSRGLGGIRPWDKGWALGVTYTITDQDFRIAVLDEDGQLHPGKRRGGGGTSNLRRMEITFPDLEPKQEKFFLVQTRPYEWIEFKDVSLKPNFKTDVQLGIESSVSPKLVMLLDAINSCTAETDLNIDSISITTRNIEIKGGTSSRINTRKFLDAIKDNGLNVSSLRLNAADNSDKFGIIVEPEKDWQQWWQQRKTDVQLGAEETVSPKLVMLLAAIKSVAAETDLNIESISVTTKSMSIEGDTSGRTDTLKFLDAIKDNGLDVSRLDLDARNNRDRFRMTVEPKKNWRQWWQQYKTNVPIGTEKAVVGEWEDIGNPIPADFNDTIALTEKIQLGSIGRDVEGKSFITFVWDKERDRNRQYRFVLINKNDAILEPDSHLILDENGGLEEKFTFDETYVPWRLKEFKFQSRPLPLAGTRSISSKLQKDTSTAFEGKTISLSKLAPPGRYAIELDGVDDYLCVPDSPTLRLEPPFTVEMWIKPRSPEQKPDRLQQWGVIAQGCYIGTGRVKPRGFGIELIRFEKEPATFNVSCHTANDGGLYGMDYGSYSFDEWMHISHVFKGGNYEPGHGHPLVIGRFLIPMPEPFMGQIGEVRIWKGARTREEISRYKNRALTGKESGLAACWTFEQAEGQFAYDMSGNNNHARLGRAVEADGADPKWIDLEAAALQPDRIASVPVEVEETAKDEIGRLREVGERRTIPERRKGRIEFFGLDLTDAPRTTKSADLPDLFEERPPGSKSYEIASGVTVIYGGFEGTVYYIPEKEVFYIQQDKLGSSTLTYYGPFNGDPHHVLDRQIDVSIKAEEAGASSGESESPANETGPRITFDSLVCDLGQVAPNTKYLCEFKYTNTGSDVLKITRVETACACTVPQKTRVCEPDESGTLKVTYRTGASEGKVKKFVYVHSNDKVNPRVKLTIKAEIVVKVAHEPKKLNLVLDKENAGCPAVTLTSLDNQPFSITGFKSTSDSITADFDSSVKVTSLVVQPKVDMEKLGKGMRGNIEIGLTHPECKKITILFDTLTKFKVDPRIVYVREAEPQKPITKTVRILSNYNEDFEIESTSSKNGNIKVLAQEKVRDGYQFELQITPPEQESKRRIFTDVFTVELKGDRKLQITCYGIYSRKRAETAVESVLKSDVHLEVAQSGGDTVYGSGDIVVVSEGKSKVYGSIQEAIDAAPAGSVVRIGPGVYEERLEIDKPLTLEGAGWDQTTIVTENNTADVFEEAMNNARKRALEATSEEQAKKLSAELQAQFEAEMKKNMAAQTHLVNDAEDVVIRNLKLTSPGRHIDGRALSVPVLKFSNARALVTGCAVVGTPGNGINIEEGSDVQIRDSLVAGVWSTGIAVAPGRGDVASARIINCDVRNCYHRGITIGPGCDSTVVEGCRISGSSWHGIRYDNASPTIIGNLIFANVRCGIYASGQTAADVSQNLFYGNEMSGISCWFKNQDKIEENTFVGNKRSGLEVLGASRPIVRKNIFYANPTGVFCGDIGDDSASAASDGTVNLEKNLFWGFEYKVAWRHPDDAKDEIVTEEVELDEKTCNVIFDPEFNDITAEDFSLKLDSPAGRSGIGAAVLIDSKSPWPIQDEEIPIIPEGEMEDTSWMGRISSTGKIARPIVPVANQVGKRPLESIKDKPRKQEGSEHPGRISGTVINSTTGEPIAGAYVGVGDFGDSGGSNYSRHRSEGFHDKTKTDAEGRFELGGLVFTDKNRDLEYHPLVVTHPDFVRHDEKIELPSGGPAPDVTVKLRPAAKIEVTIVDADGNPLQGQWLLRLEALDGRCFIPPGSDPHLSSFASNIWAHWPDMRTKMGVSNGFTFTELDTGEYSIEALKFQLVDKPSPGNIWEPNITYHGLIPSVRVQAGQAKQVRLAPQDHQTRLTITPPEFPDVLLDKLKRSSQMPLMCLISRSPGALLWDDGKIHHLEDQRLGRIDKMRFFRGFFVQGKPLTINNLPPDSYSLFTMAVYGQVAGYLIGARADLEKGDKITVDVPWRQPTGPSMFGPNRSFDYPVKLEDRDYSVSQLCEILTDITQSNPRLIADSSIENEKLRFGKSQMSVWDVLEKLYLENGWRVDEGQNKTLIIKPAEQTNTPVVGELEKDTSAKERIELFGLDLTDAPRTTKSADLSDLFEERPPGSKSYHIRRGVIAVYDRIDGTVYYIPGKEIFYIQHDKLGSSTLTYYGPFNGDPHKVLSQKKDVLVDVKGAEAVSGESKVTASEDGPRITFESLVCDLGQIPPNTKHVCEFKYTNTGNALLKITRVGAACACTVPQKTRECAPGESETLKVTYRASGRAGRITKSVYVYSNDKVNPKIKLTIKAEIVIKVAHEPETLNILLKGENAGYPAVTLTSLDNQPFSITGFKSTGDSLTAEFDPSVKETSFVLKPKVDMERLRKALNGQIEISLDHPECKTLMILYKTLPEFEFDPRVVYVREAEPLKPVTKTVRIRSNYNEDVEVESTSTEKGTVKVLAQEKVPNGHQFELQITPPVQESKRRVFMDVFIVELKGGQKLQITCYGIYTRKPAKAAVKSDPETDTPVEGEGTGASSVI